jgi:hypothetical protein
MAKSPKPKKKKPADNGKEQPVKLNMTFEEAIELSLKTPPVKSSEKKKKAV